MSQQMQVTKNEILLIYNSNDLEDKKALGYAHTLRDHKIKELDISKEQLTPTQLEKLIELLDIEPAELMDDKSDLYKNEYQNVDLDREDSLEVLSSKPELIKTPIVVYSDAAKFVGSAYEFVPKDLEDPNVEKKA